MKDKKFENIYLNLVSDDANWMKCFRENIGISLIIRNENITTRIIVIHGFSSNSVMSPKNRPHQNSAFAGTGSPMNEFV